MDVDTAQYFSFKANKTVDTILNLPLDAAYLFTCGARPKLVRKYDLCSHPLYHALRESHREPQDLSIEPA